MGKGVYVTRECSVSESLSNARVLLLPLFHTVAECELEAWMSSDEFVEVLFHDLNEGCRYARRDGGPASWMFRIEERDLSKILMFFESCHGNLPMILLVFDENLDGSVFDDVEAVSDVSLLDDDRMCFKRLDMRSFDKVCDECVVHVMEEIFVKGLKQVSAVHGGCDLAPGVLPRRGTGRNRAFFEEPGKLFYIKDAGPPCGIGTRIGSVVPECVSVCLLVNFRGSREFNPGPWPERGGGSDLGPGDLGRLANGCNGNLLWLDFFLLLKRQAQDALFVLCGP